MTGVQTCALPICFPVTILVGEDEVLRLSPIKKVNAREFNGENQITIGGVNCLDYMLLHKKYIMKEEPSYKLGDIGTKYVNLGKIEYEGNLNTLFRDDINKFIDYNLRDVEIIEALEAKLKFIDLTIMISHICNIPYESIYWNTVMNDATHFLSLLLFVATFFAAPLRFGIIS